MNYLIFDFDGVLGDTFEPLVKINAEVDGTDLEKARLKILSYYENKTPHGKDKTPEEVSKWLNFYEVLGRRLIDSDFKLFDDFINELRFLKDVKLAVVSSAHSAPIKSKLAHSDLEFTYILGFDDHHSKEVKISRICTAWE